MLKDLDCPVKVVYYLLLREVILIAVGLKGTNAGAVLIPLVLPEIRVVAAEVLPVLAHIFEQISTARVDQDERNVTILPRGIAVLIESTIAMIGPLVC